MKPNLVLIQGNIAALYIDGKQQQKVQIDLNANPEQTKREIEFFRKNGLDFESKDEE